MKRFLLSIAYIIVGCAIAFCAVNNTLVAAQKMLRNATTVEQCESAKKKFKSAVYDPNYDEAEHKADIDKGINECDAKIAQLSATLSISPTNLSFGSEGGSATLSVNTNQGTPSARTSAEWLTVERRSNTITVSCAPNSSASSRTATITVTAGVKSVQVKATQEAASLVITGVEFGQSANANGSQATGWGEPLYSQAVRYVTPRISYTSPMQQTKTISTKIYNADGSAPSGYTQSIECNLDAGANTLLYQGYGASAAGSIAPGSYAYEVWVDGKRAYSTTFEIRAKFDGIRFDHIEFCSVDANGNQVTTYGNSLHKDKVRLVKSRIQYNSPKSQRKNVYVKAYKVDGSLWTLPNSPAGYTLVDDVYFKEGANMIELTALGWNTPQFEVGKYKYDVWVDGQIALESDFTIKPPQEGLKITGVQFNATDAKISYSSPSHQKKNVSFKFTNSKSHKTDQLKLMVEFKQGKSSFRFTLNESFTPGAYEVEIYIDGKCLRKDTFEIQ